jgi:hypothetical protein
MIECDAKRRARAWSRAELKLSCKLLLDGEAAASTFESIIQRAVVEIRLTMALFLFLYYLHLTSRTLEGVEESKDAIISIVIYLANSISPSDLSP